MPTFVEFKAAVQAQINLMSAHKLFVSKASRDDLWDVYLNSFPEGTNNVYRERREYDCNCCRQFVRQAGGMLAIIDNKLVSIWDIQVGGHFQPVVDALAKLVKEAGIETVFLHYEKHIGTDKNHELKDGVSHTWEHFYTRLPAAVVTDSDSIASKQGKAVTNMKCFERSVREISTEAIEVCLDLIAQNSLYRGEEHLKTVQSLQQFKREFLNATNQTEYVWAKSLSMGDSSNIRGSVIGTLLVDLSEGVDLEAAVKSFETKVAPQNYKRPSALITQKMIDQANQTVEFLGLETAFHRRFANLEDITINNVLFADRSIAPAIGGLMSSLSPTASTKLNLDQVVEMPYKQFVEQVLPTATGIEVFVETRHESNLVSLIAPVFPDAGSILKWGNNFSWSYNGEVTDAIKERVKAAGGTVEGVLCIRLAWEGTDDLDLHLYEPNGDHIYFGSRGYDSRYGGKLDVDANGGSGMMANPVENIFYANSSKMKNGDYEVEVHNYNQRSGNSGFQLQIECAGVSYDYQHTGRFRDGQRKTFAVIHYKDGEFAVSGDFNQVAVSKEFWGIVSGQFQPVEAVMYSPNHWDGEDIGNKHLFFMLKNCVNPNSARGFYNEFLTNNLNEHRKVFEVLASKMKTAQSQQQLSGLGFSTTKKDHVVCRVSGSFNRTIKVTF